MPGSRVDPIQAKDEQYAQQGAQKQTVDSIGGGSGGPGEVRLDADRQQPVVKVRVSAPAAGQDGGDQVVFIETSKRPRIRPRLMSPGFEVIFG